MSNILNENVIGLSQLQEYDKQRQAHLPLEVKEFEKAVICTFSVTEANTLITLKSLTGATQINWGDGTIGTNLSHTYTNAGEYTCIINNVTSLGYQGFYSCACLVDVTIGTGVTSIEGSTFAGCSKLKNVTFSNNVKSIGGWSFSGCSSLTKITLGDAVETLGSRLFNSCSNLTTIILGEKTTNISEYAFYGCSSLKSLECKAKNPPTLGAEAIPSTIEKIIVPIESVDAYKNATNWSVYADKIVGIVDTNYLSTGLNIDLENGTGNKAIQQTQDQESDVTEGYFKFSAEKNAAAINLDRTLDGEVKYGAVGDFASAFGGKCAAIGKRSLAEGTTTIAKGNYSHAEGNSTVTLGSNTHAEGAQTTAYGSSSHAEGIGTLAYGQGSHAQGYGTIAFGYNAHAEGKGTFNSTEHNNIDSLDIQIAVESDTLLGVASGNYSHTEGCENIAKGESSHSEGYRTKALNVCAHSEGSQTTASGEAAHAEGVETNATGSASHAQGSNTVASGNNSHAGGCENRALGTNSFSAVGQDNKAEGIGSYAGGQGSSANANFSFAQGGSACANHYNSFVVGYGTQSGRASQFVCGEYNIGKSNTIFEVGGCGNATNRQNVFEVLEDGRAKVATAPIEADDVVRLSDLQKIITELRAEVEQLRTTIQLITWEAND